MGSRRAPPWHFGASEAAVAETEEGYRMMAYSHDGNCPCAKCGAEDDRIAELEGEFLKEVHDQFGKFIATCWQSAGGDTNAMPPSLSELAVRELWDGEK